jgi:DNA (cytosine-5)-methyltransferase 3A
MDSIDNFKNRKNMNVLSLFDGMSCGQQALQRCGFNVDNYFASEIDKYAIKVTMSNYPNTQQLGSVVDVNGYDLPKIDLLIGGSPCQSFSFAGKRKGMSTKDEQEILTLEHYLQLKSEGFEFEGQSYLFWEYMRLLNELRSKNPDVFFLLENVEMGEKWEKVLSKAIGVNGIHINSALVSAQNRKRIYWTNIGMQPSGLFGDMQSIIDQPKDKGILLKHVLEDEVDEKYFLSEKMLNYLNNRKDNFNNGKINIRDENQKSTAILKSSSSVDISDNFVVTTNKRLNETIHLHRDNLEHGTLIDSYNKTIHKDKSITISTRTIPSNNTHIVHNTMPRSSTTGKGGTGPLSRNDGKTYCLDTGNTNAVEVIPMDYRYDEGFRSRENGKSPTLTITNDSNSASGKALAKINNRIRRLTPIECERLQTVADNYTAHVSDSQRYKMLGNGWTVDVICHIFNYLPHERGSHTKTDN